MYAVFVIAAILLSVAPMHARTLLAALPANAPGHQFAPDPQSSPRALAPATRIDAGPALTSHGIAATSGVTTISRPASASQLPSATSGLHEHAPNAP